MPIKTVKKSDIDTPILTGFTQNESDLVFTFSNNSSVSIATSLFLTSLLSDIDDYVSSKIDLLVTTASVINPATGFEKNGDFKVISGTSSIRINGAWVQVYP